MSYEALVAAVGPRRYRAACEWAWGQGDWPKDLAMVPHELSDLWDDAGLALDDRLALALRFYAEMPCYAHLMYLKGWYRDFDGTLRATVWDTYRCALAGDVAALAGPVSYSLWVDFFEDPATVAEAWREIVRPDRPARGARLRRALEIAGPVPWPLKVELFEELSGEPAWHGSIRDAITASENDVFGQIDRRDAARWLRRVGG